MVQELKEVKMVAETAPREVRETKEGMGHLSFRDQEYLGTDVTLALDRLKRFLYEKYPWRPIARTLVCEFGICDGIYTAVFRWNSVKRYPGEKLDWHYRIWIEENIADLIQSAKDLCGYLPELVELVGN